MFGLGKNDNEQRMWNLAMFGSFLTDKEIEKASPFFLIITIIWVYRKTFYKQEIID